MLTRLLKIVMVLWIVLPVLCWKHKGEDAE